MTRGSPRLLALTALALAIGAACTVPHTPPLEPPVEPDAAVVVDGPKKDKEIEDAGGDTGRPGTTCTLSEDCLGGYCLDGLCCDSRCDTACDSCRLPGREGLCSPLAAGSPPRLPGVCPPEAPRTCGFNGTCDGAGGCGLWRDQTPCGSPSCTGTSIIGLRACSAGVCMASPDQQCAPYICDQSAKAVCLIMCKSSFDCTSGVCDKGVCKGG